MKLKIKNFSQMFGVSVRTLRYYDEIGLLNPDYVDNVTGYRYYGDNAYSKMHEIMFYKELDFSLNDIIQILSTTNYDKNYTLTKQKELLIIKKNRLENIINNIDYLIKGEIVQMSIFDNSELENKKENYREEVIKRFGRTEAYQEHLSKTKNYDKNKWNEITKEIETIINNFSEFLIKNESYTDQLVLNEVQNLKDFITKTQYTCTNEILLSLGEMYVNDVRFKKNIDKKVIGTAEFINNSIKEYCKKQ